MSVLSLIRKRVRRAKKDEDGSASIEFVILFPIFMVLFMSTFEAGLLMTRQVMLERAVDISVRGLRLGTWSPPTHEELKRNICNLAGILPDCMNNMLIELQPVSTSTWTPLPAVATCRDNDEPIQPVTTFNGGDQNEMMIVRACATMKPWFYATGLGLRLPLIDSENYALVSSSAFVNEPGAGN